MQIQQRVRALAGQSGADYQGKDIDVICLINGASMFYAGLVRHLKVSAQLHHLGFTSYPQGNASGEVRITLDITEPLQADMFSWSRGSWSVDPPPRISWKC